LIDERLAAMEAILAAGHIPAAMEEFSPGDGLALEPRHALGTPREGFRQNLNRHVNAPKVKH
jgi:hypothetical protein